MRVVVRPRKWTQGGFHEDERLELIEGEILEMTPQNARQAGTVSLVYEALGDRLREGFFLRVQLPLALGANSEPEPDVAVVEGSPRSHLETHPTTAALVVEVSDSSLSFDRSRKLPLYARNGVPAVWILNLVEGTLEVHRHPAGDGYRQREVLDPGGRVSSAALREPVAVAELLP